VTGATEATGKAFRWTGLDKGELVVPVCAPVMLGMPTPSWPHAWPKLAPISDGIASDGTVSGWTSVTNGDPAKGAVVITIGAVTADGPEGEGVATGGISPTELEAEGCSWGGFTAGTKSETSGVDGVPFAG
jgi:hypothetical protein